MRCRLAFLFLLCIPVAGAAPAEDADALVAPSHQLGVNDPAWKDIATGLQAEKAVTTTFVENRWFPFRKVPTVLRGESRVSAEHGLSLHYTEPKEQIVIIDGQGMLTRTAAGDTAAPADPRAEAANSALLHALRFDLAALAGTFDLYGIRTGDTWQLALVPKDDSLRRTLGRIAIEGEGAAVRRIELRRSAVQRVEILIAPPQSTAAFSPEELHRFFR
jgi:hypothetical protein